MSLRAYRNPKDQVEADLQAAVCAHLIDLDDARRAIAGDWPHAPAALHLDYRNPTGRPLICREHTTRCTTQPQPAED